MIDALYWWDEAVKFKESARVAEDEPTQLESLNLQKSAKT
jgi:hypothetical protein